MLVIVGLQSVFAAEQDKSKKETMRLPFLENIVVVQGATEPETGPDVEKGHKFHCREGVWLRVPELFRFSGTRDSAFGEDVVRSRKNEVIRRGATKKDVAKTDFSDCSGRFPIILKMKVDFVVKIKGVLACGEHVCSLYKFRKIIPIDNYIESGALSRDSGQCGIARGIRSLGGYTKRRSGVSGLLFSSGLQGLGGIRQAQIKYSDSNSGCRHDGDRNRIPMLFENIADPYVGAPDSTEKEGIDGAIIIWLLVILPISAAGVRWALKNQ
jgi:hypothetical protein